MFLQKSKIRLGGTIKFPSPARIEGGEMRIFGLKTCDTCRKAMKEAANAGLAPVLVDVRETPLSPDRLAVFLDAFGGALVNRASTTWRSLPPEEREAEAVDLLRRYPALMKRPVIEMDAGLWLGWTPSVKSQVLGQA
jgi:arsenate reductase (glutaredoxin)